MKNTIKNTCAFCTIFFCSLFLCIGGCAAQDDIIYFAKNNTPKVGTPSQPILNSVKGYVSYRPDAHTIYLYLLFNRAMINRDTKGILLTIKELSKVPLPEFVYVDAGAWALENRQGEAAAFIKQGLAYHPHSVSLNMFYAEILQGLGKNQEAITHIKAFINTHPENIDGKVELALLLINAKQFAEAERVLSSLSEQKRVGYINYYYAKALIGLNRKEEARIYLEKATSEVPNFMEALNDLGYLYEQDRNYAKARQVYEEILKKHPNSYEVVLRLIMLSLDLKEPEKALQFFEDIPMTPELNVTVASIFLDSGYADIAENILLELVKVKDAPQELYFYLAAIAYDRDKDLKKSYKWLTNIEKNNKAYSRSLLLRMQLLLDLEQLDDALRESREGQFVMPDDPKFWMAEIRILASQGRLKEALKNADIIYKKWPNNPEIVFLKASIFDRLDDKIQAVKTMEEVIKIDPNHFQALNYVGYTLADQGRELDRAVKLLYKAVELSPNTDYILDSLAWALYKKGRKQEAWKYIQQAVSSDKPHDPTIWEHYGDIAMSLGKVKHARRGYEKALEYVPSNASSIKAKLKNI